MELETAEEVEWEVRVEAEGAGEAEENQEIQAALQVGSDSGAG